MNRRLYRRLEVVNKKINYCRCEINKFQTLIHCNKNIHINFTKGWIAHTEYRMKETRRYLRECLLEKSHILKKY